LRKDAIVKMTGPEVTLIDPAREIVRTPKRYLAQHRLLGALQDPLRLFIVTDNPARFKKVGELYLERVIPHVRLVRVDGRP
jgi:glutamate racemase